MTDRVYKATSHDEARQLLLGDAEALAEYDRLAPRFRFIKQVVAARLSKGWSQADLARAIGKQRSAISRLEAGEHDPTLGTIILICRALGVPVTVGDDTLAS
jgi:DNA-binding XRE family transcriptional regulator